MTRDDAFPIKICGLSTSETLEAALAAGAEMIGLNFHPRSPRFVTPARAAELAGRARGRTQIVALIVDYGPEQAAELARMVRPDWLQLHGSETPEQVAAIRQASGLPVMKALGIATAADLEQVAQHRGVADRICSTPSRRRTPPIPAGTAGPSTGACSPASTQLSASCYRAGSFRRMSRTPSASPDRPASTSPPGSRARLASRMSAGSRTS